MYTTLRLYANAPGVAAQILAKRESVEKAMRAVPGFVGYRLMSTADGFASVTICEAKEGCDQTAQVAAAWLKENLPAVKLSAPTVITGESHLSFGAKPSR